LEEPFDEELQKKLPGPSTVFKVAEQSWQAAGKKLLQFENDHDMERIRQTDKPEEKGRPERKVTSVKKRWMTEQENQPQKIWLHTRKQLEQLEEKT